MRGMDTDGKRSELRERIDTFVRRVEMKRMPPDRWEGHWTTLAIAHLRGGDLTASENAIRHAETPYRLRPQMDTPMVGGRHLTIEELRFIFNQFLGPQEGVG